jgi:hypothetical protein
MTTDVANLLYHWENGRIVGFGGYIVSMVQHLAGNDKATAWKAFLALDGKLLWNPSGTHANKASQSNTQSTNFILSRLCLALLYLTSSRGTFQRS